MFDFESAEGWTVERGDLSAAPSFRSAPVHRHGKGFLGTAETAEGKRDAKRHGILRSPPFEIDHDYFLMRAGVSGEGKHCFVRLRNADNDSLLFEIHPKEARMLTHIWDARRVLGERVVMQLVDNERDPPCSVHIDWVRLVDE